jgi:hypothetical protein
VGRLQPPPDHSCSRRDHDHDHRSAVIITTHSWQRAGDKPARFQR